MSSRYRSKSSVYRLRTSVTHPMRRPLMLGCALMAMARGSTANACSKGDMVQPCQVPWDRGKESDILPLTWMQAVGAW